MDTKSHKIVIRSSLAELAGIRDFIARSAADLQVEFSVMEDLQLAADEAVTNIINHGYGSDSGSIDVNVIRNENQFIVSILDDAPFFNLNSSVDHDLNISPLDQEIPGGYGVTLIRRLTDEIKQRKTENGRNELLLIKFI